MLEVINMNRRDFTKRISIVVAALYASPVLSADMRRRNIVPALITPTVIAPSGFKTEWVVAGDATARTITLPLVNTRAEGALAYNFTVDWGDGSSSTVTAYNDAARAHTYAANGTYIVEIKGTMEGWSFNNGGDKLKITKVLNWGESGAFNGFKYLKGGFYGCSNLASIADGSIPASGTGVLTDGFKYIFYGCSFSVVYADLFKLHTLVSTDAFFAAFMSNTVLTTIHIDTFKYNTLASSSAFRSLFQDCYALVSPPSFRFNISATVQGFENTFYDCRKLKLNSQIFYALGEESTRFLNRVSNFTYCLGRVSFSGTQGTAPALWDCDFGTQTPTKTNCFAGAGNSLTSLDNYASIPTAWKT